MSTGPNNLNKVTFVIDRTKRSPEGIIRSEKIELIYIGGEGNKAEFRSQFGPSYKWSYGDLVEYWGYKRLIEDEGE